MSEQLRRAIRDSGEDLSDLARGCGVAYAVLYRFTHGQRSLNLNTASRVVEYLGLELRKAGK